MTDLKESPEFDKAQAQDYLNKNSKEPFNSTFHRLVNHTKCLENLQSSFIDNENYQPFFNKAQQRGIGGEIFYTILKQVEKINQALKQQEKPSYDSIRKNIGK